MKTIIVALTALLFAGCDSESCTLPLVFPLTLQVNDSVTGQPIISPGGEVRQGETVIALTGNPLGTNKLALTVSAPTGAYRLDVHALGYLNWHTAGLIISKDKCGLFVTQNLVAKLVAGSVVVDSSGRIMRPGQSTTIHARLVAPYGVSGRSRAIIFSLLSGDSAITLQPMTDTTARVLANHTGQAAVNAAWSADTSVQNHFSFTISPQ